MNFQKGLHALTLTTIFTFTPATLAQEQTSSEGPAQVVFLNFDAGGPPTFNVLNEDTNELEVYNDHIYTPQEREEIQRRIEIDYTDFNFIFTQTEPVEGDYSTLRFGENDRPDANFRYRLFNIGPLTTGFSLGRAFDGVDFRNQNRSDDAFIDPSRLEFFAQFDPTGELLAQKLRIPLTTTLTELLSEAVITFSANIGSHELGHMVGLRHHDSFGAPGRGITPFFPIASSFTPEYTGPREATETFLHLMATGTFNFSDMSSDNTDRFFSERSALKLTIAEQLTPVLKNSDATEASGQIISLETFDTPNTILSGENAAKNLITKAAVIQGNIADIGRVDSYAFGAEAGTVVTLEVISSSGGTRFSNPIDGIVTLFYENPETSELLEIATNNNNFEDTDSFLNDIILPTRGVYIIQVSTPPEDQVPLGPEFLRGDYELLVYTISSSIPE